MRKVRVMQQKLDKIYSLKIVVQMEYKDNRKWQPFFQNNDGILAKSTTA